MPGSPTSILEAFLLALLILELLIIVASLFGWSAFHRWLTGPHARLRPLLAWPADLPARELTVVIAAHNEESGLERCVHGILTQSYHPLRVLVVDDRSTDRTAEIAQRLAAADSRVTCRRIDDLPPGRLGKANALAVAANNVSSDLILFIDGDVHLEPGAVPAAVETMARNGVDLFSLLSCNRFLSFWEGALNVPTGWLLGTWVIFDTLRTRPAAPPIYANGQFLLITQEAYRRCGGFEAVADELTEDYQLARNAAAAGCRGASALARGLYVTERAGDFRQAAAANSRMLIGALRSPGRLLAASQVLLGFAILPIWALALAAVIFATQRSSIALALAAACLTHLAIGLAPVRRMTAALATDKRAVKWFPLGAFIVAALLVRSAWLATGRGWIRWGPNRYRLRGSRVVQARPA